MHEAFKSHRQLQLGMSIDDPNSDIVHYPQLQIGSRTLANGNYETEFRWIRSCRYFYEINLKTRTIVGWRFEGSEKDCAIVP